MKKGDKVIYVGKDSFYSFIKAIFIQELPGKRCEVKPDGCQFVTCDPPMSDIRKASGSVNNA